MSRGVRLATVYDANGSSVQYYFNSLSQYSVGVNSLNEQTGIMHIRFSTDIYVTGGNREDL